MQVSAYGCLCSPGPFPGGSSPRKTKLAEEGHRLLIAELPEDLTQRLPTHRRLRQRQEAPSQIERREGDHHGSSFAQGPRTIKPARTPKQRWNPLRTLVVDVVA